MKNMSIVKPKTDIELSKCKTENYNFSVKNQRQPVWEKEEVILLVCEYYRTKNLAITEIEHSIEFISKILRKRAECKGLQIDYKYRNIAGISMKFGNMKALDREVIETGKSGLKGVSKMERLIVEEYNKNPEILYAKAYNIVMKYVQI